jgi:IS4 transposase
MHNIKTDNFCQAETPNITFPLIAHLIKVFNLLRLFSLKEFHRGKGISTAYLFEIIVKVMITGKRSIYAGLCSLNLVSQKSTVNTFLNDPFIVWRDLTLFVAKQYTKFFKPDAGKHSVLIFDDSSKHKSSEKAEHVSTLYDSAEKVFYSGYEFLLAVWTNLRSCIPVDFILKTGNRLKTSRKCDYPNGSHMAQRHRESRKTKITLVVDILKRILKHGIIFKYVLWDAGYKGDELYAYVFSNLVPKNIHLVTRIAHSDETYIYNKKHLNISQIIATIVKWEIIKHKDLTLKCCSVEVTIEQKYKKGNRLRKPKNNKKSKNKRGTYIRNKEYRKIRGQAKLHIFADINKKNDYFVLLSTDTELSAEEVLKLYAIRWSIELVFKDLKSYFGYNQSQSTKYAPQIADLSIKCAFYTMLCSRRERQPNKSMYQLLLEFAHEFEHFCLQMYHLNMVKMTITGFIDYSKQHSVKNIKQLPQIVDSFVEDYLWPRMVKQFEKMIL